MRNEDSCIECGLKEVKCPVCEQMRDSFDMIINADGTVICKYCANKRSKEQFEQ
jgi:hypothetical protein